MSDLATNALQSLDLSAAWLRRVEQDSAAFVQRLGFILKEALPAHVSLNIQRKGLWRKTESVVGVQVNFEDADYTLALSPQSALVTACASKSRGIVLSTKTMPLKAWMEAVIERINATGQQAQAVLASMQQL
jgi:hypothetical protein